MARSRRHVLRSLVTPGSNRFWRLRSHEARLIFIALVLNADDFGRLQGDPSEVISLIPRLELDKKRVQACLADLAAVRLIQPYESEGERFIYVVDFEQSQVWHGVKRESSKFPAPPGWVDKSTNEGEAEHQTWSGSRTNGSNRPPVVVVKQQQQGTTADDEAAFALKEARTVFHSFFPRRTFGTPGKRAGEWSGLVARHGLETVVEAVKLWSENLKESGGKVRYPIWIFLTQAEEFIEMAGALKKEETLSAEEDDFVKPPMLVEPLRYERKT